MSVFWEGERKANSSSTYVAAHAHTPSTHPPRAQTMADPADKNAVKIMVPSKDKKDDKDKKGGGGDKGGEVPTLDGVGVEGGDGGAKKGKKKKTKGGKDIVEPEELSEEDKALKEGLELAVTRVDDPEPGIGRF